MHLTIPAIFSLCAQLSVASAVTNNEDVVLQRLRQQNDLKVDGNILSKLEEKRFNLHTRFMKNNLLQVQSRRFKRKLEEIAGENGQYRFVCPNDEVYDAQEGKCTSLHPPGPTKPPEAPDSSTSSSTRKITFEPSTDAEGQSNEPKTPKMPESSLGVTLETSKLPSVTPASSGDSASEAAQRQTSEETAPETSPSNDTMDTNPTTESSTDAAGATTQPNSEELVTQEKASTLNVFLGALLASIILTTLIGTTSYFLRSRKKNQAL